MNEGDYPGAADRFPVWNKVNGEAWLGLTRRRLAEQALFLGKAWQPFLNYEEGTVQVLKLAEPRMQAEDIRRLQEALKQAGINIEPDGFFGNETDRAVKQFPQQKGLTADGIVGAESRRLLGL
ncbi:peptidoglycan-binding protein [Microcoleus sp. herbarium12]|uniref:peptidoglycan-binding protein n=1 Tax=Microcoleus sp. herbarium12 TaxID=3055437 RepID=UPI002FD3DF28